ncbi:MAG: sulfatase-like hydrolase/transferase [Phycisphaerae bacterium]|nr:sulfatase-like hydrolase/transferase [Phycisphaerae bacterium]NIP51414.1 sulfatase-like hydrolase/transferase [Phycisphaerae bacterium]NIS50618.1 sulfatase-like hydrolase/transferase [Phycisphaerae bacterium]NIU08351.1 sulfatase-like hydrolase/transferase [Phycisphaerae bacterium]NIU55850.1 sulfatase-like hydrolase/transferase [Phycisphaerae bacterium]
MVSNTMIFSRRRFLKAVGTAAVSALPVRAFAGKNTAKSRKPNFVFIFADDLGWGDLGCYGNRQIKTPNLDELAKKGTLFTQFYVSGSVCSPSRAAIMTSHFPARHGIHGHFATHKQNKARAMPNWLDPKVPTVTKLLKDAGYITGHFGKWHLGSGTGAPTPGEYGIDEHSTRTSSGPQMEGTNDPYFRAKSTAKMVDKTIEFIENNRDKPFYVNVWTLVPHATLHPTDEQMKPYQRYAPRGVPYKGAKQIYYASVTDLDQQIGRLVRKIDEMGLADNTIIAFSSDNGPEDFDIGNAVHSGIGSAGPFRGRKRSIYEGGIRMPFIVRWPGHVPAGKVDDTSIVAGVDWLPTVCSLAGVKLGGNIKPDGEDMSAALLGKAKHRTRSLMWEWRFRVFGDMAHKCPMLAIRDGKWKLLMNPDRSRIELYDIPKDPTELDNVADKHPDIVKKLSEKLLKWQKTLPKGPYDKQAGSNAYPWPKGR